MNGRGMDTASGRLVAWYEAHRRALPWRETRDAYRIWISEVILQQTRVAQGLDYYLRFTARFPDVRALAAASEDEVLKLWQGLGYYSRARSLHAAAREVVARFGGVFPERYEDVRSLPGIGEYTAAAVCSIAYGQPHAVVDGNVYRVLSRRFDLDVPVDSAPGRKLFAELAASLLDTTRPGLYNQAVMELGALQCVPRSPDCAACPLSDGCLAYARGTVAERPVKRPRRESVRRYFNYLHIRCGGRTLIVRRSGRDIWRGLYEFPLVETTEAVDFAALQRTERWRELFGDFSGFRLLDRVGMPPHVLSHRVIHAVFYRLEADGLPAGDPGNQQLADGNGQRDAQQRQRDAERIDRRPLQSDIYQQRAQYAQQQAAHAEELHRAGHVEPFAEVVDLLAGDRRGALLVLFFQVADHLGISQKTVRVGQHDQRDGREENGGRGECQFFHGSEFFVTFRVLLRSAAAGGP